MREKALDVNKRPLQQMTKYRLPRLAIQRKHGSFHDIGKSYTSILPSCISNLKKNWQFHVLLFLPLMYFIIFNYVPMYGIIVAFKDFSFAKGILGSEWVGLKYVEQFFSSFYFWRLMRNTLLLGIYSVVFAFPAPLIYALALNEIRLLRFKKIAQAVSYIPYFISTVVVIGMMYNLLSVNDGLVNQLLNKLGFESVNFISSSKWFRPLYVGSGIWQGFGFGSIIYLAAMSGIDSELYEAAEVDGGNRLHKIWFITLPGIRSTVIILLILSLGSVMSVGFEKVFLMYSPGIYDVADVIQTYLYRKGIEGGDFSYSTAIGLFSNVINFALLVAVNAISRKLGETSLW